MTDQEIIKFLTIEKESINLLKKSVNTKNTDYFDKGEEAYVAAIKSIDENAKLKKSIENIKNEVMNTKPDNWYTFLDIMDKYLENKEDKFIMKVEINDPVIETVYKDIEENEIFIIPRYQEEGKVFIKLKGFTACTSDTAKECNAICLNDGSFAHLDYDEFVIPCKSELRVWKVYKEENQNEDQD